MSFDGSEGTLITLSDGAKLTSEFRRLNPGKPIAYFMGREKLRLMLDQPGAVGLRIYMGVNAANGETELVSVAADMDQNDMLALVTDGWHKCPPASSTPNALNS